MQGSIVSNFRLFIFTLFSGVILVSCGGGSNDLPGTAAPDTAPPYIISTTPHSEQAGVDPTNFIKVTL